VGQYFRKLRDGKEEDDGQENERVHSGYYEKPQHSDVGHHTGGWISSATTVTHANDGLTIYFVTGPDTQKVKNIKKSGKVSLTIDKDYEDWNKIKGLSMTGTAEVARNPDEIKKAMGVLAKKFPAFAQMSAQVDQMAIVKITPKFISVLNYELGFGHTDLVEV
jgi:general stress protein 26